MRWLNIQDYVVFAISLQQILNLTFLLSVSQMNNVFFLIS